LAPGNSFGTPLGENKILKFLIDSADISSLLIYWFFLKLHCLPAYGTYNDKIRDYAVDLYAANIQIKFRFSTESLSFFLSDKGRSDFL
jgi:hypothetical protein